MSPYFQKNISGRITEEEFEAFLAPFVQKSKSIKSRKGGIIFWTVAQKMRNEEPKNWSSRFRNWKLISCIGMLIDLIY